jgi:hypothetical protein
MVTGGPHASPARRSAKPSICVQVLRLFAEQPSNGTAVECCLRIAEQSVYRNARMMPLRLLMAASDVLEACACYDWKKAGPSCC